ncbi:helix-turn-helix domain-containing protein [Tepidibacter hydrothermalis]|uniref:Helix-turn-helix transcriptional regulator n=1 Tax=Tepidibacter hydrothermalis TaxID=3036126 RepID=A0ABY8ELB4_9FIRM|nr:helix-turn-helix transcriptional regulator [Tepidibacter hydrothermalis]WFD12240.1 helix-turn-helix transcriptional regulator [Tepidibacter hydrothermalis]
MDYGKRLESLMFENGITPTQLSEIIDCPPIQVSPRANDNFTMKITTIKKLSSYFNVTTDYLIGVSDENKTTNDLSKVSTDSLLIELRRRVK